MKTNLLRIGLRLSLVVIAVVSYLPVWAEVGQVITQSGIKYIVTGNETVSIVGLVDENAPADIKFPARIEEKGQTYKITEIYEEAFMSSNLQKADLSQTQIVRISRGSFNCASLSSVILPPNLVSIESSAFSNATIKSIEIPASVKEIGYQAFSGTFLESIDLRDVETIGAGIFRDCSRLTTVILPIGLKTIPASAFHGCKILNHVDLPDGLTTIEGDAFSGCEALTTVKLPKTVTDLQNMAFRNSGITSIDIPESITSLSSGSIFSGCKKLSSVTLPNMMTYIGERTFENCTSLKAIIFPDNLEDFGQGAFSGCTALTSITIPANVRSLGFSMFYGCTTLTELYINSSSLGYDDKYFEGMDKSKCTLYVPYGHKEEFSKWWTGFKAIKEQAISSYKVIYKLGNLICNSPTTAFPGKDFTFQLENKGSEEISMISLRITIDGKPTTQYTAPSTGLLGEFVISGKAITGDVNVNATGYTSYKEGPMNYYLDKDNKQGKTKSFDVSVTSFEIPQKVTSKGISYTVNTLGYQTFNEASKLTSLTIPASMKYFEGQIFRGCSNLKEIHLLKTDPTEMLLPPDGSAFEGMDMTKCTIYVPKGCLEAFKGWAGFSDIREEGSPAGKRFTITRAGFEGVAYYGPDVVVDGEKLEARLTPESGYVLGVGDITVTMGGKKLDPMSKEFFYGTFGKDTLTIEAVTGDVVISAKARKIGGDLFAAGDLTYRITGEATVEVNSLREDYYTKGQSYTIPSSVELEGSSYNVTGIGEKAFSGRIMEAITIPSSVETIGTEAFLGAQADEIHIQRSTPPSTVNGSFNIQDKNKCKVYVPKDALSAYHTSSWDWLGFPYIMEEGDKFYDVTFNLSGLTVKPFQPEIVISGRSLSFTLVPDSGNLLPDSIEVWYVTGPEPCKYDAKTGKVTIDTVRGTLAIKAQAIGALLPDENTDITIGKDSTYTGGSTTGGKFNGVIGNDEELTKVKSLKIDTEEGEEKVTGITLKSLIVGSGSPTSQNVTITETSNIEITLDGDNNLGKVLNQGITRLLSGVNTLLNAVVENEGTFIDETGLLDAVTGPADLAITQRPEQAPKVENGSSTILKVEASAEGEAILSYIWQKFDSEDNIWKQVKPEVKPETQRTKALSSLRSDVINANEDARLEVSEAGKYRCLVSNTVDVVTSTLTTYSEVSIASSTPDPTVTFSVALPSIEGATLSPSAGTYSVKAGGSFSFSLTLNADYDQSIPIVKVGDKVIEPASDGKYEIKGITSDITISIIGIVKNTTVGNVEVESNALKVWGSNGVLHIRSAHAGTAYLVTFGGQLYKAVTLPIGETMITVPQGSYIIRIENQSYKIRF